MTVLDVDTVECVECKTPFVYDVGNATMLCLFTHKFGDDGWERVNNYLCSNCTVECADGCGRSLPKEIDGTSYLDDRFIGGRCSNCSSDYYFCERCDEIIHCDDACVINGGDSIYCHHCVTRVATWCSECDQYEWHEDLCSPHDDNIHNYGYKPDPIFHGTDEDNKFLNFGIELEVEAKRADLGEGSQLMVDEWDDFAYLKEDGSLNFGFEIVTHPATLKYYQQEVNWRTIEKLRGMGFRSWDTSTCGLHVHIDRRAFKDRTHLLAMTYLLNRNWQLSQHVAGRNSSYGSIGNDCKYDNVRTIKSNWGRGRGGERYMAINLQNNNTVEIRMFKGSLKVERVLSAIEFCHAVVQYSAMIRSGNQAKELLRPEEFTSWIRKQGKYPNLVQFLPEFQVMFDNNDNEMEE